MENIKALIAKRAAKELKDGDVVNLGIGIPTRVANFVPDGIDVIFHSENGLLGIGPYPDPDDIDVDIQNAGAQFVTVKPCASFFDPADSFGMIRGGHLDVVVLGALEVDRQGNLASWIIPGGKISGMGGSMDLVVGAKKVIITMFHTQKGSSKILDQCTLPLTAVNVVDKIITEMGVMEVTEEGLLLTEYNPDYTLEQIKAATGCDLIVSPCLKPMEI